MDKYTQTPDFYKDYISHHGILGMRWGQRNGPPYPLNSKISTGKRLKAKYGGKGGVKEAVKKVFKKQSKPSLNRTFKDLDNLNSQMLKRNQDFIKQTYGGKNVDPSNEKPKNSIEQDVKNLNISGDGDHNCAFCSMAYEMRRRNLDATVTKKVDRGLGTDEIYDMYSTKFDSKDVKFPSDELFKDSKNVRIKTTVAMDQATYLPKPMSYEVYTEKALTNYISKNYPDGARGVFLAPWASARAYGVDAGHCVSWELNKGKLSIIDAQDNSIIKDVDQWLSNVYCYDMIEFRTDDKTINKKYIKKGGIK